MVRRPGIYGLGRVNKKEEEIIRNMQPALRYPGSKWNIARQLVQMMPEHHSYVEPFFGSGAVLFNKPLSDMETVNDLDSDVVNLFRCIQMDPERLAGMVMTTPLCVDDFQKAAAFLVRCWQGHGYRTNGQKVGWKNDVVGREKAYALWNWYRVPERIIDTAERLRMVQIENRPALDVIRRFNHDGVFMYIDPPYLLDTRAGRQYAYEMTDAEHEELLAGILQSRAKIMISGYESQMYNSYLKKWNKCTLNSCAEHGRPRTEVVWMNYRETQLSLENDFPEVMP